MTNEEAISILSTRDNQGNPITWQNGFLEAYDLAIEALQKQKTGKWIDCTSEESLDREWKCSVCNQKIFEVLKPTVYCPYCGAKMEVNE